MSIPGVKDLLAAHRFIRHIAVNTRIAEVLGNELLGYGKFIGDIRFIDGYDERMCVFSDAGQKILRLSVNSKVERYGEWERNTMSVSTYKHERLYRLTYQTRHGVDAATGGSLVVGPHPLGRMLACLDVSPQPVVTRYSSYFQLLSDDRRREVVSL